VYSNSIKQILLIIILLCANVILAQKSVLSSKISVNFKNANVEDVIKTLEKKTGVNFSYSNKILKNKTRLTYSAEKTTADILKDISEQTNIDFVFIDGHIVVKKIKRWRKDKTQQKKEKYERYTISGFLKDNETGENLISANVIVSGTNIGVISNEYGFYSLTLPRGKYTIDISYIGFNKQTYNVDLNKNIKLNSTLKFNYQILSDVEINADEELSSILRNNMCSIKLKPKDVENIPEFAGEIGLTKTLENIPGIKTYGDGSAFIFVRGGNKDQNLILIDEAPIYNSSHLFGIYSVIIPETTKEINIYKSNLPVNAGDRISSLIDIRTKEGNMNKFGFGGLINPFIYHFHIETPIVKQRASAFVSFRHSNIKWMFKDIAPDLKLYFYDFNAKLNFKINDYNRIYYSLFYGKDEFSTINEENFRYGINWANQASTFRWNHIFNDKIFSNISFYGSKYNYNFSYYDKGNSNWNSSINNLSVKIDITHYTSPKHTLKYGFNQNFHSINPGNITGDSLENVPVVSQRQSRESVIYFNSNYKITDKLSYNAGFRIPIWANTGETIIYKFDEEYSVTDTMKIGYAETYVRFINFDPRLSFKYKIDSTSAVKASFGIHHQYLNLITNSTGHLTSLEVWLPADLNIKPQRSDIYALSYLKYLKKYKIEFNTEVFYKKMYNQIDYNSHANLFLNPLMEGELRFGSAYSYGAEFMLKKSKGKFMGWVSYTYARVFMNINGVNNNKEFPAYFDQPHSLSIYANYQISKRFSFSANLIYHTGGAITSPVGFYKYNGNTVPVYGDKNNDRLPDYHRLDISAKFRLNKKEQRFNHSLTIGIYNVYNRKNIVTYSYNKTETSDGFKIPRDINGDDIYVTTQTSLLGFIPSLSYRFKF